MTDILCPNCDYEIFHDKNELSYYIASLRKRYDEDFIINILLMMLI